MGGVVGDEDNRHAGKPGKPGERGTGQRGGAGGAGGVGGEGVFEGGPGGTGGTGGQMVGPRGPRGPTSRRGLVGYLILTAGVTIALFFSFLADNHSDDAREALCRNQAAVVEMQRLFLAEHANIRAQLRDAGVPDEPANHDLLNRLRVLIESADCDAANIE